MAEGDILWQPSSEIWQASHLSHYVQWLSREKHLSFPDYAALWHWSIQEIPAFWKSIWEYFALPELDERVVVMSKDPMPRTRWFEGVRLNYAAYVFKQAHTHRPALWFAAEDRPLQAVSWQALQKQVAGLQYYFQHIGLQQGIGWRRICRMFLKLR